MTCCSESFASVNDSVILLCCWCHCQEILQEKNPKRMLNLVDEEDGVVNDSDNPQNISLIYSSIFILIVIAESIWHIRNFLATWNLNSHLFSFQICITVNAANTTWNITTSHKKMLLMGYCCPTHRLIRGARNTPFCHWRLKFKSSLIHKLNFISWACLSPCVSVSLKQHVSVNNWFWRQEFGIM